MKEQHDDLKQLQVNLHYNSQDYSLILNVDEFKNSGSILFMDQGYEIKKLKKHSDSYGIEFVAKINGNTKSCSLKMTSSDPETIITLFIGEVGSSATVYHETADFIFYFFRDLKVPTIKNILLQNKNLKS